MIAVATPHEAATAAAVDVVHDGGGVVDAALAAAITLCVVYPHNAGVGGDLFALLRDADGQVRGVNASGRAARRVDAAALRRRHGGRMPVTGTDTITVPGAVAGWQRLHELGGTLPWHRLFESAVRHASDGVAVTPSLAQAVAGLAAGPDPDRDLAAVLAGDAVLRQPALAQTLRALAEDGPGALYGGRVGQRLAEGLEQKGCPLRTDDLADYRAQDVAPLRRDVLGRTVWTTPPNSQGFALLQTLLGLQHLPADLGDLLGRDADVLAALFSVANGDRDRYLADPDHAVVSADMLLDEDRLRERAELSWHHRTRRGDGRPATGPAPDGDTVAVVVADDEGRCVSLIESLFHSFGSGVLEPATGIVLHNRGAFFSLDPGSSNVIAPGKRPAHTLMPVLVTEGDELSVVAGTMGGKGQPQIHAQVLLRLFEGAAVQEAVAAGRWVVGGLQTGDPEDMVQVEASVPDPAQASLREHGWPVRQLPAASEEVGHAQYVTRSRTGVLEAASDPRSDGTAAVVARA